MISDTGKATMPASTASPRGSLSSEPKDSPQDASVKDTEEHQYPGIKSLALILLALYLAMFLVALVSLPLLSQLFAILYIHC